MNSKYAELLNEVSQEHNDTKNESLNDRVLIIDGLNQFIRVFGAVPALNDDGEHCGGVTGFLLSTAATIRRLKPTRVVIVFDGKGGSNRRKKVYKKYKEGRTGLTKLNRLAGYEDLEDQKESMSKMQFTRTKSFADLSENSMASTLSETQANLDRPSKTAQFHPKYSILICTDFAFPKFGGVETHGY